VASLDFASENLFFNLSLARWRHLFEKFGQNTFNRCVQNDTMFTMFKCTKNHANRFKRFEDVGSQT